MKLISNTSPNKAMLAYGLARKTAEETCIAKSEPFNGVLCLGLDSVPTPGDDSLRTRLAHIWRDGFMRWRSILQTCLRTTLGS